MRYFITATSTDSGKTLVSALLCEALNADYWKPIHAGRPTDSEVIRLLTKARVHPEAYLLERPMSPHAAAEKEGRHISLDQIKCPLSDRPLVIEGAGGLLVPINKDAFIIDLISYCQAEAILVVNTYLGCINHALLSIEALKNRGIKLRGLVFNGERMPESEAIIEQHSKCKCLLRLPMLKQVNAASLLPYVTQLRKVFK